MAWWLDVATLLFTPQTGIYHTYLSTHTVHCYVGGSQEIHKLLPVDEQVKDYIQALAHYSLASLG